MFKYAACIKSLCSHKCGDTPVNMHATSVSDLCPRKWFLHKGHLYGHHSLIQKNMQHCTCSSRLFLSLVGSAHVM
jgi:hypothetical protein